MTNALIVLCVIVLIVGFVAYIATLIIDRLIMDAMFKQIAQALVLLIAVLIILAKALPLLGMSI